MPDIAPIPIVATGFSWTAFGAVGTFITVLGGLITLIIKQIGPWRRQTTEAEEKLRKEMSARIDGLEKQVDTLRAELIAHHDRCDKIIAEIRSQHALEMHDLRERHLVELASALGRKMADERPTQ